MTLKTYLTAGVVLSLIGLAKPGLAQTTVASDNAGNYSSGWTVGSTGGTGFGAWSFNDVTPNGGFSGQFLGSSGGGGIDSGNGNSFGMYANSAASAEAQSSRTFSAGSLLANQTFSIQMLNGNVTDNGGQVGFNLQDSSAANLFQFYFAGGGNDYQLNVGGSVVDTGVTFTSGPLTLDFNQGVGNTWSFSVSEGSTLEAELSSTSTGDLLTDNDISQLDLYNLNGGASRTLGDNANLYFNTMAITTQAVPEPANVALFAMGGLAMLLVTRRRR
jgi:hypothetical protein